MPPPKPELSVVMPVYNEAPVISEVVTEWLNELDQLVMGYEFRLYNDGSSDETAEELEELKQRYPQLTVTNKENEGHGPTILRGYRESVAPWVFQTDSDGEIRAKHFESLWAIREDYDALFGTRVGRKQNAARAIMTAGSRLTVRLLFGKGVEDVNTPYRLIRSEILKRIVAELPDGVVAPNIIIAGALSATGVRIWNQPVPHEARRVGSGSLGKWKLWKVAGKSLWQILRYRRRAVSAVRSGGGSFGQ